MVQAISEYVMALAITGFAVINIDERLFIQ